MRIALFADSYRPYTSGVVRSIDTFREELEALGNEVYIFAPRYGRRTRQEKRVYRFYSLPSPTNPDFNIAIPVSLRLKKMLRKLKIDLVHVHSPFMLGRLGAHCARSLDLPLVFTHHTLYDHYVHYMPVARNLTKKITQMFSVSFCNRCDKVLVPTNVIGEYIKGLGVTVPVQKLPTGIKVEEFQHGDPQWLRQTYKIAADRKILLFVGRMGQEKNVEFLLRAYRLVVKENPASAVSLVLVGGGPETDYFKDLAGSLGIADKVVFTGSLPMEQVVHCYTAAHLFVFPSVTETQGLVIGEAKAAGVPTVAVNAFGVQEMVENGEDGFLTPVNEEIFAKKISLLLSNHKLYQKMAAQAQKNAHHLSSRHMAMQLEAIYRELIGKPDLEPEVKERITGGGNK